MLAPALVVLSAGVADRPDAGRPLRDPRAEHGRLGPWDGVLLGILGLVVILLLVAGYVRFAPRFSKDEESLKVVRADRVRPGQEPPRRAVDIKAAAPVIVAPPPLPEPAGVAAAPAAAPAPAAARRPPPPRARPSQHRQRLLPPRPNRLRSPRLLPRLPPQPLPRPPPLRSAEVALDQEVFDATLEELLDKGTDRRVAEGQARRAAMIAARKKAAGEG